MVNPPAPSRELLKKTTTMEYFCKINIVNPKDVGEKTFLTVDKFLVLSEILERYAKKDLPEERLSGAYQVMRELAKCPQDISQILSTLEKVTMEVAYRSIRTLMKSQNTESVNRVITTKIVPVVFNKLFTKTRIHQITKMNWVLESKVKKHAKTLDNLIKLQEKCKKHGKDYKNLEERLKTAYNKEKKLREEIIQFADDVYMFTRKKIKQEMLAAIECLDYVSDVLPAKSRTKVDKLLDALDVNDIVDNLLVGSSQQYTFPDVETFQEKFGSDKILPPSLKETPKDFFSVKTLNDQPLKGMKQRFREKLNIVIATGSQKRVLESYPSYTIQTFKGQGLTKTSTVKAHHLAFGWSLMANGVRGIFSGKKWGFFFENR